MSFTETERKNIGNKKEPRTAGRGKVAFLFDVLSEVSINDLSVEAVGIWRSQL